MKEKKELFLLFLLIMPISKLGHALLTKIAHQQPWKVIYVNNKRLYLSTLKAFLTYTIKIYLEFYNNCEALESKYLKAIIRLKLNSLNHINNLNLAKRNP